VVVIWPVSKRKGMNKKKKVMETISLKLLMS